MMQIEQIYTGCLAQGAYYLQSDGEAIIIDPLREIAPYLARLEKDKVKLKYILETHFHADFVSGHIDLAQATGATIVYGPHANPDFNAHIAQDGEELHIGSHTIKCIHTPGHTLESTCYLLLDEHGKEVSLFSGDTLFLGDVGRPDLAQKSAHMTQDQLAGMLYDSLYQKILPLPDHITVYPAHGAGSACGKNMMKETVDLLGNQKKMNYALNQPSREAFIEAVTDGLLPPPAYFGMNVAMNKKGYSSFESVLKKGLQALNPSNLAHFVTEKDALILDTRGASDFAKGFIPGSINIGLKGDFAPWVGTSIGDVNQSLVLIVDEGSEEEAVTRLSRVGFDQVHGYLQGGIESWKREGRPIDQIDRISATQMEEKFQTLSAPVIDVRKEGEYQKQHLQGALHLPLAAINDWMDQIPDKPFYLHCAGGYRSMIAASILYARGIRNFKEIEGGYNAIAATSLAKEETACTTSCTN
jgi:hydroxyacylglutathione hydrolase